MHAYPRIIIAWFLLVGFSPLGGWVFTGQLAGNHQRTQKNVHITFSNLKIIFILSALFRCWSREKRLPYTKI